MKYKYYINSVAGASSNPSGAMFFIYKDKKELVGKEIRSITIVFRWLESGVTTPKLTIRPIVTEYSPNLFQLSINDNTGQVIASGSFFLSYVRMTKETNQGSIIGQDGTNSANIVNCLPFDGFQIMAIQATGATKKWDALIIAETDEP